MLQIGDIMIFTEELAITKTNLELEHWNKYFYDRVAITIKEFDTRKKIAVDHFVKIEAEMDVKQQLLINDKAPKVDDELTAEMHTRITTIENELNMIRDTQKSDELKTNARLDFMRKQIIIIEKEQKTRLHIEEKEPKEDELVKKLTKKEKIVKKLAKKSTKRKTK